MRSNRVRLFEDTRIEEACGLGAEATNLASQSLKSVDEVCGFDGLVFTFGFVVLVSGLVTGAAGSPQVVCSGVATAGAVLDALVACSCLRVSVCILTSASFQRPRQSHLVHQPLALVERNAALFSPVSSH